MARVQRSDVLTSQKHIYSWLQRKGSRPDSPLELLSLYGSMGGIEEPTGAEEPIYRKSLSQRGRFRRVGSRAGTPEANTTSFREGLPRSAANIMERLHKTKAKFTVQNIIHQNADPEDPTKWESKVITEGLELTSFSMTELEAFDSDAEVVCEGNSNYEARERVLGLSFGQQAGTEITKEALAADVYPLDDTVEDEDKEIWIVQKLDTNPKVAYRKLNVWATQTLSDLASNDATDLKVAGQYVLVTSQAGLCYMWARRDNPTSWSKVTGGFVASKGPNCMYVAALSKILMVGNGGYIYRLSLPSLPVTVLDAGVTTTQNLNAIHGLGDTIVAVGAANVLVCSLNGGKTWALKTGPAPAIVLNCVWVVDENIWFVGADKLYYTLNQGLTWTESPLGITGMTKVTAVAFSNTLDAVGYAAGVGTGPAGKVKRTTTGGGDWEDVSLVNLPANEQIDRLVASGPNFLVAVGLVVTAGDGFCAIASD